MVKQNPRIKKVTLHIAWNVKLLSLSQNVKTCLDVKNISKGYIVKFKNYMVL